MVNLKDITFLKCDLNKLAIDPFARLDFKHHYYIKKFYEQFNSTTKFKKLRDITTLIETGKSIEKSDYSEGESEYVHIVPRDVQDGILKIKNPIYLNSEKGEELADYRIDENDVLLVISSNVGDSVIFSSPDSNTNYTISHYMIRLKINDEEYNRDFLVHYLNHPNFKSYFRAVETGKTQQNLSKVYIRNLPIIDISKDDQETIVKEINRKCDELLKHQQEIQRINSESEKYIWENVTKKS